MRLIPNHKPRFVGFVAASIDGRISLARKKMPDWTSREDWQFFQRSLTGMDAVVVGRNTYQAARTRLRGRTTYVFSNHIPRIVRRGSVTFFNPEKCDVREILSRHATIGVLGGSRVYGWMIEHAMLDEIFVTIEPRIFGRGTMMITDLKKTRRAKLISCRRLNTSGTMLYHYQLV